MYKKNNNATAKPWQPRWWRENPERWRWAGTLVLVFMLMGAFAYQNPHIWQQDTPPQLAEEDTGAALPEPQVGGAVPSASHLVDEQPQAEQPTVEQPQAEQPQAEQPQAEQPTVEQPQAEQPVAEQPQAEQPVADAEDAEPAGMQQLEATAAIAVSAAPSGWQQPGYGTWARGYGYALDPTQGDYRFHHGCDMELSVGSPVFAAASGKVLLAAEDAAWGGVVIVEHGGGWRSLYKGIQPEVSVGATVVTGEQLGLILPSPGAEQAQNSHLHFEMELNNEKQDPAQWL